jgi:hypothetical protein
MVGVGAHASGPARILQDFVYAQQQATATGSDAVVIDIPPRSR